ncbi:hypothetical protein DBR39_00145 [Chryseobacterium sp. KBW03]|uniref:hypothetical protein n=1 Tax=Chryseobacterium sp. KBW03 TaxID=2153362 RepID=UPI000F5ACDCD|nr:hypothetical protein [Chryseobacterium sp. KBW03]RQO42322.1 hypothetical protein DBR39_00145 [Chryseobacterium sp. KBW03]
MKIKRKSNFFMLFMVVLLSCKENNTIKKNIKLAKSQDQFEQIFSKKEYSDYDKINYEKELNEYQDSLKFMSKKIESNLSKITDIDDRNQFVKIIKDDSLFFYKNLDAQTNMIYYSYNGFSDGMDGEKNIYTNLYYLNNIKDHLTFLKGVNYNLEKNIR